MIHLNLVDMGAWILWILVMDKSLCGDDFAKGEGCLGVMVLKHSCNRGNLQGRMVGGCPMKDSDDSLIFMQFLNRQFAGRAGMILVLSL